MAAFDEMARRYRDVVTGLEALDIEIDFDVFDRIVTHDLHGVDLNAESVEITRLSLWLKTARRDHRLQNLEATIKDGDSLIADAAFAARPFDWRARFPDVFAAGGFDVVIGNPQAVHSVRWITVTPYQIPKPPWPEKRRPVIISPFSPIGEYCSCQPIPKYNRQSFAPTA